MDTDLERQYVEVNYFCEGKFLGFVYSKIYPTYKEGDSIELQITPSPRDLARRPAQDVKSTFFVVDRVHHIISENTGLGNALSVKMDVILVRPPDIEDSDTRSLTEILKESRKNRRKTLQN